MKKSILKMSTLTIMLGFVLVGCGMTIQQQFLKAAQKLTAEKQTTANFNIEITDLQLDDALLTENPLLGMLADQVKASKIDGEVTLDQLNKNSTESLINVNIIGNQFPLKIVGTSDATYLSIASINQTLDVLANFSSLFGADSTELNQFHEAIQSNNWQDSYITLNDALKKSSHSETSLSSSEKKTIENVTTELNKKAIVYLNSLNKELFDKKEDTISLTLNKDEIQGLAKNALQTLQKDKKYQVLIKKQADDSNLLVQYKLIQQLAKNESYQEFKKLEMDVSLNQKNKEITILSTLTPIAGSGKGLKNIQLKTTIMYEKFKGTPQMPDKKQLITEDQLNKALAN